MKQQQQNNNYVKFMFNHLIFSGNLKNTSKPLRGSFSSKRNVTLLARYCKEHKPKSCEHSLFKNATHSPRPCSPMESFLTSGDSLTLELKLGDSTALRYATPFDKTCKLRLRVDLIFFYLAYFTF